MSTRSLADINDRHSIAHAARLRPACVAAFAALLAQTFTACSLAASIVISETAPAGSLIAVSQRIRLIADSQLHEFHGAPTYLQSREADNLVEVALRPSQQRMFAANLLKKSLAAPTGGQAPNLILHLGDAIDVSCTTEWDQFTSVMDKSYVGWTLVPGNHDGFFTGNLLPPAGRKSSNVFSKNYGSEGWRLRCGPVEPALPGGARLDKRQLLERLVDAFKKVPSIRDACESHICLDDAATGIQVRVRKSTTQPWSSYLTQKRQISLAACLGQGHQCSPVYLVLLDTSTYSTQPTFVNRPAGTFASLSQDQFNLLRTWMVPSGTRAKFIVAGHHSLSNFGANERRQLVKLMCDSGTLLYISAHTHVGYWKNWHCDSGTSLVELNVGSVLDWPSHFRDLVVMRSDSGELIVDSAYSALGDPDDVQICDRNWIPARDSGRTPSEQQLYKAQGTSLKLGREALNRGLIAELLEYRALVQLFPTDPAHVAGGKEKDEQALQRIERTLVLLRSANLQAKETRVEPERLIKWLESFEEARRTRNDAEREQYKVCLGLWAARMDHTRTIPLEKPRQGKEAVADAVSETLNRTLRYVIYPSHVSDGWGASR